MPKRVSMPTKVGGSRETRSIREREREPEHALGTDAPTSRLDRVNCLDGVDGVGDVGGDVVEMNTGRRAPRASFELEGEMGGADGPQVADVSRRKGISTAAISSKESVTSRSDVARASVALFPPLAAVAEVALQDLVVLAKPRITFMVVVTAAGGLFLSRRVPGASTLSSTTILCTLVGCALIVSGANALNMYIERDVDRHMDRTKQRPLPSGRMKPRVALWFGVLLSIVAIPILALGANALTALLAVLANLLYVFAYTPLKQHSAYALHVGAIPGAIPPLLGWTAGTGRIDAAGGVLFAILFLWQIPHFCAIALFRKADYARAGIKVLPNVTGELASRHTIVRWTFALLAASLLVVPLGLAHRGYLVAASLLGAIFFGWGCYGLRADAGVKWAKSLFGISILYLVLLFTFLTLDI